jgi:hypothetical protein
MTISLFGDFIETCSTYASRIIAAGVNEPSYKIQIDHFDRYEKSILLSFHMKKPVGFEKTDSTKFICVPGLYVIYEGLPSSKNCLYVGHSKHNIHKRIYRFMKELKNISRHDEGHPAAKKARLFNVNADNIYIKFIPEERLPVINGESCVDDEIIDQYVAPLLGARFNKRVKK